MLAEYVRRGGGLIVFGGHKALDRAGLKGSLLEEVLPVTGGAGIPPLVALPGGAPLARGAAHPVTQFADFDAPPVCFYVHDLQARPEAQTIITVGGKPGLVVGKCGKGRVAVDRHDLLRRARRVADALLAVALVGPAASRLGLVGRRSGRAFLDENGSNAHGRHERVLELRFRKSMDDDWARDSGGIAAYSRVLAADGASVAACGGGLRTACSSSSSETVMGPVINSGTL